jgi:hypothetical protein
MDILTSGKKPLLSEWDYYPQPHSAEFSAMNIIIRHISRVQTIPDHTVSSSGDDANLFLIKTDASDMAVIVPKGLVVTSVGAAGGLLVA